ncbi:hypothetical protein GVN16_03630 [Emticicia sp. CRIBPO]|uniref:YkgJ family cysteine cluster protein n=1 Tax=Emticicia sp. CRIBPO TaxID=2683258 RepID=UPI0014132C41|nr:YkgJ family cysteine cluster protein [Emticicia sp. CRIBPO]NBA84832.1 hypothetical protein [Emticicia sp. CRIBPO]
MNLDETLSSICMNCGLCCDGSLFNRARIWNEEDKKLAESLNLTTFSQPDDKMYFSLPCPYFKSCCSIYDRLRPNTCGKFFCEPLKKLRDGELTELKTRSMVETAVAARNEVMELARKTEVYKDFSFSQVMREVNPVPSENMKEHKLLQLKVISARIALSRLKKK